MKIKDIVSKYINDSLNSEYAESHAASDIILHAISNSEYCENVTIKGGILMYNLTNNINRPTADLDFDMLHYSIDSRSIERFVEKLNESSPFEITLKNQKNFISRIIKELEQRLLSKMTHLHYL